MFKHIKIWARHPNLDQHIDFGLNAGHAKSPIPVMTNLEPYMLVRRGGNLCPHPAPLGPQLIRSRSLDGLFPSGLQAIKHTHTNLVVGFLDLFSIFSFFLLLHIVRFIATRPGDLVMPDPIG